MIANVLQISGAATVALGLGLWWPPLGVIALGIFAILFGLAMERN